jgi:hypothetical protein
MIELRRDNKKLRISSTIWTMTLELARLCGWVPRGTRRDGSAGPDGVSDGGDLIPWIADYISNDGQTVTAEDAGLLADSLDRASKESTKIIIEWQAGRFQPSALLRTPATGFGWFNTRAGRQHLLDVAAFCRGGEFQIC